VIASNNSGLWNEIGDTLEFSIAPAYYQTTWFYASCEAAVLAMLWGLHQLRLRRIAREFNAQLDGRVEERLRHLRLGEAAVQHGGTAGPIDTECTAFLCAV
jgi:hypothetical protein